MGDQAADPAVTGGRALQGSVLLDWARLLRLPHWVKNAIVFPALLLAGRARDGAAWQQALWVFAAFCLASSAVYALNDVLDQEADRAHPLKRSRPVAAGRLPDVAVYGAAALLALAGFVPAAVARPPAALCVGLYLALNVAYSLRLKHVPVVDAACIAAGFVFRVVAVTGLPAETAQEILLLASVFGLCFFVALAKRAVELRALAAGRANGRSVLRVDGYTRPGLRCLLWLGAVLTLALYGLFAATVTASRAVALASCVPVAYSVARLARLSVAQAYDEPVGLLRSDRRLVVAAVLWLALWVWIALG